MNTAVQQRINMLEHERIGVIQNPGLTILGGCDRVHQQQHQEEDSVFMTPKPSPSYSTDGNTYTNDLGYTFSPSQQHSPASMGSGHLDSSPLHTMPPQCPPPSSTNVPFLAPGSPCEDQLCGSPYSPPYDNSSPHSIACSSSPHGSPIPCSSENPHYPAYISPSNSIHDIPSSIPLTSGGGISVPYSMESSSIIYSVPTSVAGYFTDVPPTSQWMAEGTLPNFNVFPHHSEQSQIHPHGGNHSHMIQGELDVNIIDQHLQMESEMPPPPPQPLAYYDRSCSPPETQPTMFYELAGMPPVDMSAGAPIPPYTVHKPTKSSQKPKKPKPVVQVNDEHIKDIPTSAQLWEFTLRVLKKPAYHYMINWENRKEGLFRFHDAPAFAALWGKHRNRPNMTYDKVARALRYYYKRDILNQVGGRLTYRFSKRLGKLYATDES